MVYKNSHLSDFVFRTLHSSDHTAISAIHHPSNEFQLVCLYLCVLRQHKFHSVISIVCIQQNVHIKHAAFTNNDWIGLSRV